MENQNNDNMKFAAIQIEDTTKMGVDDISKQEKDVSMAEIDNITSPSPQLEEPETMEAEASDTDLEKEIIQSNTTYGRMYKEWEDQKALGLQPTSGPETISKHPQFTDVDNSALIAKAPPEINPDIIPESVGGAKISASNSLARFRSTISPKGLGGDFKEFG